MRSFLTLAVLGAAVILSGSCTDEDSVSVSPALGDITISPLTLYTGQKATVNVTYSNFGEHVYYSSGASYICNISGNGYNKSDSIAVFYTEDLRMPQDFSFQTVLPPSAGTYTLTFRTPVINKSAGGKEGESIFFQALTKQKTINIRQADAINANFGDSRETVSEYIEVNDTTFTSGAFDAAGKATTPSKHDGFIQQLIYKFKDNALAEVDDKYVYSMTGIIYDDNGNITSVTINADDATRISRKVQSMFLLVSPWELVEGNIYDPEIARDTYANIADNDNIAKWTTFLSELTNGTVKSYTYRYQHNSTNTHLTITLYADGGNIVIENKYTNSI